jgi:hypothetical protein
MKHSTFLTCLLTFILTAKLNVSAQVSYPNVVDSEIQSIDNNKAQVSKQRSYILNATHKKNKDFIFTNIRELSFKPGDIIQVDAKGVVRRQMSAPNINECCRIKPNILDSIKGNDYSRRIRRKTLLKLNGEFRDISKDTKVSSSLRKVKSLSVTGKELKFSTFRNNISSIDNYLNSLSDDDARLIYNNRKGVKFYIVNETIELSHGELRATINKSYAADLTASLTNMPNSGIAFEKVEEDTSFFRFSTNQAVLYSAVRVKPKKEKYKERFNCPELTEGQYRTSTMFYHIGGGGRVSECWDQNGAQNCKYIVDFDSRNNHKEFSSSIGSSQGSSVQSFDYSCSSNADDNTYIHKFNVAESIMLVGDVGASGREYSGMERIISYKLKLNSNSNEVSFLADLNRNGFQGDKILNILVRDISGNTVLDTLFVRSKQDFSIKKELSNGTYFVQIDLGKMNRGNVGNTAPGIQVREDFYSIIYMTIKQ